MADGTFRFTKLIFKKFYESQEWLDKIYFFKTTIPGVTFHLTIELEEINIIWYVF